MLETNHYDFILVDYKMPEHDGIWFMKNVSLPRNTKVLLTTSFIGKDLVKKMFSEGICGYIAKPFDEQELLRHLAFHSETRTYGV